MLRCRAVTIVFAAAACASVGTVRPSFRPFHEAVVDTIAATSDALLTEIQRLVEDEGLQVRIASSLDGYLETRRYNVITQTSDDADIGRPERVIVLRFWIDPLGSLGHQLTAEAAHQIVTDPSLPFREAESMAAAGHEGSILLIRILEGLRDRLGGERI